MHCITFANRQNKTLFELLLWLIINVMRHCVTYRVSVHRKKVILREQLIACSDWSALSPIFVVEASGLMNHEGALTVRMLTCWSTTGPLCARECRWTSWSASSRSWSTAPAVRVCPLSGSRPVWWNGSGMTASSTRSVGDRQVKTALSAIWYSSGEAVSETCISIIVGTYIVPKSDLRENTYDFGKNAWLSDADVWWS